MEVRQVLEIKKMEEAREAIKSRIYFTVVLMVAIAIVIPLCTTKIDILFKIAGLIIVGWMGILWLPVVLLPTLLKK